MLKRPVVFFLESDLNEEASFLILTQTDVNESKVLNLWGTEGAPFISSYLGGRELPQPGALAFDQFHSQ
jgi:hypothetical protein